MAKKTVKKRIFLSNTLMVLVTLFICLAISMLAVRIYSESIERELELTIEQSIGEDAFEELLGEYTIKRNEFLVLVLADGLLCILALAMVSQIFTRKLAKNIMIPLDALAEGARRIRSNDLTEDIKYQGYMEFEEVCDTFNDMRKSILTEQERNRKYEKARTDMIAGISHDLRTPLTAIRGTLKGLLDGVAAAPEQKQKFLQTAYRRAGEMDILLNQLFDLSKLETGNMPINVCEVAVSDFAANYAKGKQEIFAENELEITCETNGVTAAIEADPKQLYRIFDNLLENSRKYAEAAPLKIRIAVDEIKEGIEVCFADNGVGVPKEKLPYVFDEFYRADESRNKTEGNGLGLYIVKYLIEAMGGSVTARNADGFSVCMIFKNSERGN